jgi:hypothetical protein
MSQTTKLNTFWFLAPAGLLIFSLAPLPYGYYQFLRLVVTIAAGFIAFSRFEDDKTAWAFTFGGICILFNPIFPIYMSRDFWAPVDVVVALIFLASWWAQKSNLRAL